MSGLSITQYFPFMRMKIENQTVHHDNWPHGLYWKRNARTAGFSTDSENTARPRWPNT
jgi:hypothetical protein